MGFLFHAMKIKIPYPITLTFFLNIFIHARFLLVVALTRLGLYKPPPEEQEQESNSRDNNYILILDGSSPSLVPVPVYLVTAAIKKRVPILQYKDLQKRQEEILDSDSESEHKVCTICLECIEWRDEIRELCNCSHVFHRDCLDTWIDEGQVTCPLCRSMLLPPKTNLFTRSCNEIQNNN